jgi:hypothetical protein
MAIIIFMLIAGGAVYTYTFKSPPRPGALYLIDLSQSMSLENKAAELSRVLEKNLVAKNISTEYWGFSDSVRSLKTLATLDLRGRRTDIGGALSAARRKNPGSILLLSDGWHNGRPDPQRIAAGLGIPVYAIGLGKEPIRDVVLNRIHTPQRAYLNDTITVLARLQSFGFQNDRAKVRLFDGQKILNEQTIPLSASSAEQEVEFKLVPKTIGRKIYSVVVEEKPGEDNYQNNRRDFGLDILKRQQRILYLSNAPNPNSQFLKTVLAGEEVELVIVVALTANRFQSITADGAIDFLFPSRLDCDCLILDNIDATRLNSQVTASVTNYARTGGVLVLGGAEFRPAGLAAILPFLPKGTVAHRELFLAPAPDGIASPLFADGETDLLADVPPFYAGNESQGLNPDGRVLAWDAKSKIPLIGYRRLGTGRILEFSFFPLWRWGLSLVGIGKTQDLFKKFLMNCLYFLSLRDEQLFRLSLDKSQYFAGEDINFIFEARLVTGAPLSGLDASVAISPAGKSMPMVERSDGVYEASWPGLAPGTYRVTARGLRDGKSVGEAAAECAVSEQSLEFLDTGRNAELLKKIAEASGGKYYGVESLPPAGIAVTLAPRKKTFRFAPQNNPFFYLAFAALFGLELFLRKRRGMP